MLDLLAQLFCREKPENKSRIPPQCPDTTRQRIHNEKDVFKRHLRKGVVSEGVKAD